MPRDSEVTYEKVCEISKTIQEQGGKVTARAIRAGLGDKGSLSTIHSHLQVFRESKRHGTGGMQQVVIEFLNTEIEKIKLPLVREVESQQQEIAELAIENDRQLAELNTLHDANISLQADVSHFTKRNQELAAELAAIELELRSARQLSETLRSELASATTRLEIIPQLEKEIDSLRTDVAAHSDARTKAEQSVAVLTAQRIDMLERLDEAKKTTNIQDEKIRQGEGREHALATSISALQIDNAELRGRLANLNTKI